MWKQFSKNKMSFSLRKGRTICSGECMVNTNWNITVKRWLTQDPHENIPLVVGVCWYTENSIGKNGSSYFELVSRTSWWLVFRLLPFLLIIDNLFLLIKHENEVAYDDVTTASWYQSLEIICWFCLMTPSTIWHLAEYISVHLKICPSFVVFNLVKLFKM